MKRKHPESDLQKRVTDLLKTYENLGRLTYFPVPNGMHAAGGTINERAKKIRTMKDKGQLRPGVADLIICTASGQFGAIELKAPKGGSLTEEQKQFRDRIRAMCGLWAECRSEAEVQGVLDAWTMARRAA